MKLSLDALGHLSVSPGDLGAAVLNEDLVLPVALDQFVRTNNLRSAEEFFAFVDTYPSALASSLGWSLPDARKAVVRLSSQLRPKLGELAESGPRNEWPLGAMKPTG